MSRTEITQLSRVTAHERQVAYVRASLLAGVEYGGKRARRTAPVRHDRLR